MHLFEEYSKKELTLSQLVSDVNEALKVSEEKLANEEDKDKKEMYRKMVDKVKATLSKSESTTKEELLNDSVDVLSTWLDKKLGKQVTDNSIFSKVPKLYEARFHEDMAALNVSKKLILYKNL